MPNRINTNLLTLTGTTEQYRFNYNGMEVDNEVSGNGNSYTTEFRQYDPRLGRWKSLDPLMADYPNTSPYVAFNNNPIYFIDPTGLEGQGHWYGEDGTYLGDDGKDDDNVYIAPSYWGTQNQTERNDKLAEVYRVRYDKALERYEKSGKEATDLRIFQNGYGRKLDISHDDFLWVSGVIKAESGGRDANETKGIAHAINNMADENGKSLKGQLMEYSTVPSKDSKKLSTTSNDANSLSAKSGLIDVLTGGNDVTNGATHWDGTDFLAWGMEKTPYGGIGHAKFREYGTIKISASHLKEYISNTLEHYTGGRASWNVGGARHYYSIPAPVFTNSNNLDSKGNFSYSNTKKSSVLQSTSVIGETIFWQIK